MVHMVAFWLLVIGGLNWLLVGLLDYNVVMLLGESVAKIVYILVGLSAIYEMLVHNKNCTMCKGG